MDRKEQPLVENGSKQAPDTYYIKVVSDGPYIVYGNPPFTQEIIKPDEKRIPWEYAKGMTFDSSAKEIRLCRCGVSSNKPFCDGAHKHANWDPRETASHHPLLEHAEEIEGPTMTLYDNEEYCALARFCDAKGRIWNLIKDAKTEEEKEVIRHEAGHCPAGRLVAFDKEKEQVYEPPLEPSISILEDPGYRVSGPIWVKGGIRIESSDGKSYPIRNRVTLCRCGMSNNKPFCDGSHVSTRFEDGLPWEEVKEVGEYL